MNVILIITWRVHMSVFMATSFEDHSTVTVLVSKFFCIISSVLFIWQFLEKAFAQFTLRWVEFVTETRGRSPDLMHVASVYRGTEINRTRSWRDEIIAWTEHWTMCVLWRVSAINFAPTDCCWDTQKHFAHHASKKWKSLQSLLFSLIVINLQKKCINLNDKFCDNIEKIIKKRILCQLSKGYCCSENMFFF